MNQLERNSVVVRPEKLAELRVLTSLMFRISRAVSAVNYLMMAVEPGKCDPVLVGRKMEEALKAWRDVMEQMKDVMLFDAAEKELVDNLLRGIIIVAKRCGIPVSAAIRKMVEVMGPDTYRLLDEDVLKEYYGASDLYKLRNLLRSIG